MKKTNFFKVLLVALSLVLVFSLVACSDPEPQETEDTKESISEENTPTESDSKAPEGNESKESEPAESDNQETASPESGSVESEIAENTTAEETETTEPAVPTCQHSNCEEFEAKEATCTEDGNEAYKVCKDCQAIINADGNKIFAVPVIAAGHKFEAHEAKAPTCTEDGNDAYKVCTACGEMYNAAGNKLFATPTIPKIDHVIETIPAADSTCNVKGNDEYKKCSACDTMWNMNDEIIETAPEKEFDLSTHKIVNKGYMAPTASADGNEAYTTCEVCNKIWDAKGEELDAIPTLKKIDPNSVNKYWGVEAFAFWKVGGAPMDLDNDKNTPATPSKFKDPVVSDDRSYARFERDGYASDGNVTFMSGNTGVTGQYLIIKYRTDHVTAVDIWANTTENGHHTYVDGVKVEGAAYGNITFIPDGEWHVVIYDLSSIIKQYVKANDAGEYVIQWARIDLLNGQSNGGYIDLAYLALCDNPAKAANIIHKGDGKYCSHVKAANPTYTNLGDNHSSACLVCGGSVVEDHFISGMPTWNNEAQLYTASCACGAKEEKEMLLITESNKTTHGVNFATAKFYEEEGGFVRYTVTGTKDDDKFIHVYHSGTVVTGNYAVIKYRVSNKGENAKSPSSYSGSIKGPNSMATDGNDCNTGSDILIGDGNWHYIVVACDSKNFVANDDGTYSAKFLRIGLSGFATDGTAYIDIAEVAFADNLYACENYAFKNNPNPLYVNNLDKANCELNGAAIFESTALKIENEKIVIDLDGKTVNDPAAGLLLGGWCCTPGGVSSFSIRVTEVNGENVADPKLVLWKDVTNVVRKDIYTYAGKDYGFSDACAKGAAVQKSAVDLSAYAGKKISFEIVVTTNYGAEIVVAQINDLTVAAAG